MQNLGAVLEEVTGDGRVGELPPPIAEITSLPGAWESH